MRLKYLLIACTSLALAACLGTETESPTSKNNSDPGKSSFFSSPGPTAGLLAKRARVRAKIDSMNVAVEKKRLEKKSTASLVGYLKPAEWWATPYTCPNNETVVFMDDEDDVNNSQLHKDSAGGWIPAVYQYPYTSSEQFVNENYHIGGIFTGIGQPNHGQETKFRFCQYSVTSLPRVAFDYAVARLGEECPSGTYTFTRFFDNEDTGNANFVTGTFDPPQYQDDDGTYMGFCFVPKDSSISGGASSSIGLAAYRGGVFAKVSADGGQVNQGWLFTDDEDEDNSNEWEYSSGSGDYITRFHEFAFGTTNTNLRFAFYTPIIVGKTR